MVIFDSYVSLPEGKQYSPILPYTMFVQRCGSSDRTFPDFFFCPFREPWVSEIAYMGLMILDEWFHGDCCV